MLGISNVKQVSCGVSFFAIIDFQDDLYIVGNNKNFFAMSNVSQVSIHYDGSVMALTK